MLDIAEHIEYLLLCHDCVVVPGLGAFLVNDTHAYYDPKTCHFFPPKRTLGFNPEVRHNDGLLVASISRKEGMSIENARMALESEITAMRHQLGLTGEIAMGNLGSLHKGVNPDAPVFEPSNYSLSSLRYAGLKPITIQPVISETDVESEVEDNTLRIVSIPAPLKIVASIVVIMVALGILYSTRGLVRGPEMTFASLDTGISSKVDTALPLNVSVDSALEPALSREIALNISYPAIENNAEVSEGENSGGMNFSDTDRYLLVVASLPSHNSALRHINGNPDLRIIEMDGNYRVYVGTAPTITAARSIANDIVSQYPNVWVCKR